MYSRGIRTWSLTLSAPFAKTFCLIQENVISVEMLFVKVASTVGNEVALLCRKIVADVLLDAGV